MRTERLDLDASPHAPREARDFVAGSLTEWRLGADSLELVHLLTSELVTNAVLHTDGSITICVSVHKGTVRIEVVDDSPARPTPRHPEPDQLGGRGLLLVEELADDWGHQQIDGGKSVWFELSLDRVVEDAG